MNKPMTKQEWLSYIEKTWDTAQREAWGETPSKGADMTREDIIAMAQECQLIGMRPYLDGIYQESLERFAALVAAAEREECAKVCEEKQEYSMPIPCPDGISGCLVAHYIPARREKTGSECAAAIRARGQT